jgi:NAD(P)H-nitrite reductase large subunit
MNYLIIGNGVSSIGAIEGIRAFDPEGKIVVVSEENVSTYGRPLISYYLARKIGPRALPLRAQSYYKDNAVTQKLGVRVERIDIQAKEAVLADGKRLAYDKLLLATGGVPNMPPIVGLHGPDVYTFTQKKDAEALMQATETPKRAAIIGAGLIALKAAEGLAMRGVDVTLVVRSRLMRTYFDEEASALLVRHLERKGIAFMQGATPSAVLRNKEDRVVGVDTDKGRLDCDLVVMAAGVRPNTELAAAAGLDVGLGVLVDDHMRTSDPNVYAAGDLTEAQEMLTGQRTVMPIWPNAYNQGYNAGANMAGAGVDYPGSLNMNSIAYYGLPTVSVGLVNPPEDGGYQIDTFLDKKRFAYRKLVFLKNRLVGCILIGDVDHAGFYTGFIRFRLPLDEETRGELVQGTPSPLAWPEELLRTELRLGGAAAPGSVIA